MTVIAGLVAGGRVLIGGDSAGVSGSSLTPRRDAKVFTNGPYVVGFTSSFRMGQIVRYGFTPPILDEHADDDQALRFMATEWVDGLRKALDAGGWVKTDNGRQEGGTLLVGFAGRLFCIGDDFQVGRAVDDFDAVGCASNLAAGALHATAGLDLEPEARMHLALSAAERFSTDVCSPFTLVWDRL